MQIQRRQQHKLQLDNAQFIHWLLLLLLGQVPVLVLSPSLRRRSRTATRRACGRGPSSSARALPAILLYIFAVFFYFEAFTFSPCFFFVHKFV